MNIDRVYPPIPQSETSKLPEGTKVRCSSGETGIIVGRTFRQYKIRLDGTDRIVLFDAKFIDKIG